MARHHPPALHIHFQRHAHALYRPKLPVAASHYGRDLFLTCFTLKGDGTSLTCGYLVCPSNA